MVRILFRHFMTAVASHARVARVATTACAALLFVAGCDVHGVSAPGTLSQLVVSPDPRSLSINATAQFQAAGTDFSGAAVTVTPVWSVVSGGGTISPSGMFTAGTTPGTYTGTVMATSGDRSATATVTVTVGPLASITLTPNPASLAIRATQQFAAVGRDASGNVVQLTPTWSVVAGGGTITGTGLFTAGTVSGPYVNTVQVSSGGISATATVVVTAGPLAAIAVTPDPITLNVGAAQQFTAAGRDASGNAVAITPVWTIANGGGTILGSGVFTAGTTPGTFANSVTATSGGVSGTATVSVSAGPLASITVTPNPASLAIGAAQQFTAVGNDASGNVVAISPTWSIAAGGGTIDFTTGRFTAGNTAGTYTNTVRASVGGTTGFATVTVTAGPLASLTVMPNPVTLQAGGSQQFTAIGVDAGGNVVPVTPTWSITDGGGSIGSTGDFTAGNTTGTYVNTVRASVGATTGSATVTVTAGALAAIRVVPNPITLQAGSSQQFTATGVDAGGNLVAVTPTWSVANGGGTIGSTGVFTAGAGGGTFANTVQASSGGVSGSATVTVTATPVALAQVTVSPNPAIVAANGTQQFAASGFDATGASFSIAPVWAVVNGGGTINAATGLFTAGPTGGTFASTVRATSGSVSGFATVTVTSTPPVLTTITVSPNPAFLLTNGAQQFSAVGRDANGNVFLFTPTWQVVAGGGSIGAGGLFTAGANGGTFVNTVRASSGAVAGTATVNVTAPAATPLVNLGSAALNGIMAGTAVTCVNLGTVNANVSISPGNTITGFGPCTITGVQHLNDAVAVQDQIALTAAYNTLAGLPCGTIVTTDLGGTTKGPGVYCSASTMGLTGTLTLDGNGDPNATFVFQIGSGLTTAGAVALQNGAQAKNVYWQVGSSATLGTGTTFRGNILALTSITLVDNTTMIGRALARNGAVSLGTGNIITLP
jgi:hypothetical protein